MKMHSVEILDTVPHESPTIYEISRVLSDFPSIKTIVFDRNPMDGLFDYESLFESYDDLDYVDNYIYEHSFSLSGCMTAWDEVLCREFLRFVTVDWLLCFLFAEKYERHPSVREKKWLWAYNCTDGATVEVFSPNINVINVIKKSYRLRESEYPGGICKKYDDNYLQIFGIENEETKSPPF